MSNSATAEVFGLRALCSDEQVYVLDVNQWMGAFLHATGRKCVVRVNAVTGPRVLEYALRGRKTAQGFRVVIGSSRVIMETFVYTLDTHKDPEVRASKEEASKWFLAQIKLLNQRGAILFDRTLWEKSELDEMSKTYWGMPDWEDQGVYQTLLNLDAAAIIGLDEPFMDCVTRNGRKWFDPQTVRSIMAA
jgi:hypothetical protein